MPLLKIHYYAKALQMASVMHVVLPEGGAVQGVCFLLGPEGSASDWWLRHSRLCTLADERQMAFVLPSVLQGCGFDMAYGYRFEQALCRDIPEWLSRHLPCLALSQMPVSIAGYRLGGTGAAHAALDCPDLFGTVGCFDALLAPPSQSGRAFSWLTDKRRRLLWGDAPSPDGYGALEVCRSRGPLPRFWLHDSARSETDAGAQAFRDRCGAAHCTLSHADCKTVEDVLRAFLAFADSPGPRKGRS